MLTDLKISVIDPNPDRRLQITRILLENGIHVEPFDSADEMLEYWPNSEAIFLYQENEIVSQLTQSMHKHDLWRPIVAYSEQPDVEDVVTAILSGALDYLTWPFSPNAAADAIVRINSRRRAPRIAAHREAKARERLQKLTKREREVLSAVSYGMSSRVIASKLGISPRTVEIHRANLLSKLGAKRSSEAIRLAVEANLDAWRLPFSDSVATPHSATSF